MAPFVMLCLRRVAIRALPLPSTPIAARLRPITTLTSPITRLNKQAHFVPPLQRRFASEGATRDEYETATESVDEIVSDTKNTAASALGAERPWNADEVSTVFVGNLFFHLQQEDLVKAFESVGPVKSAKIAMDHNNQSRGFGYVEFEEPATAQQAVQSMNLKLLEGRPMAVQLQNARAGNMPFDMSDRDLNNLFSNLKNIIDVRVAIDRRTGQPRGFAHADFADEQSAEQGLEILRNTQLGGRTLRVDFSLTSSNVRAPGAFNPSTPA